MTTRHSAKPKGPRSSRSLLLAIWGFISRRRRIQLGFLFVVMLASGLAELLSLGAVLPFLAVLSDPNMISQHPLIQVLINQFGFIQQSQLLLLSTFFFGLAIVLAAIIRLMNLWLNGRMAAAVGSDLSCEAYRRTLYQPYEVHVQRNSAEVITATTTEINRTVLAMNSLLQLATSAVVTVALLTGLLLIDASVAISSALLFGSAYWVFAINARRELHLNSIKIASASTQQLKALQEGLGAIRDVLLDGTQPTYLNIYQKADRLQRQLQAKNSFIGSFPRYALEALGMVAVALLGGLLVLQRGNESNVIPLLGALALGAQRLLPALQQIYSGWALVKGYNAAIEAVLAMLRQPVTNHVSVYDPLPLRESIRFENIYFHYSKERPEVLRGVDLQINFGERIGLVGTTGSGKSTMLDLLMGLLTPSSGSILVDGLDLHDLDHPHRLANWRSLIAHVPQNIFLVDSSIAENIAFGASPQDIDYDLLRQAASQAQIASFIESSPEGYDTFVGERGIRMSGGQRQRIGIARALYKQAKVLVFDEATSALDTDTEKAVMTSIEGLSKELTIIMIAHRLSTLRLCDRIIKLEKGEIIS